MDNYLKTTARLLYVDNYYCRLDDPNKEGHGGGAGHTRERERSCGARHGLCTIDK